MFNVKFNLHTAIADLYPNVRKSILFTMVGSLNATIVSAADKLAERLEQDGYDFRELTKSDYRALCLGADDVDGLAGIRADVKVANEWRELLRNLDTRDDPEDDEVNRAGSWYATLNLMSGAQGTRPAKAGARAVLKELGIIVSEADVANARREQQMKDQSRANARAKRKSASIAIYETVFNVGDNSDTEYFSELPVERREQLTSRFFSAMGACMTKATQNVIMGAQGDVLGLGDIALIRDTSARLMLEAFPITPIKVAQAKAKVQRVTTTGKVLSPEQSAKAAKAKVRATKKAVQAGPSTLRKAPGPLMNELIAQIKTESTTTS